MTYSLIQLKILSNLKYNIYIINNDAGPHIDVIHETNKGKCLRK